MHWKTSKLKDICATFADGDWIESKDQSPDGIRLVQTGNIGEGVFKERNEKARYVSKDTFYRLKCTEVFPQDCLISRLPDPVGRACIVPDIKEKMITGVDCTIVRFKPEVSPRWFTYYSLSQEYYTQIQNSVGGATRQRISRTNLGDVLVPVPLLSEQKRIVAILDEAFDAIAKAKENAEKNLANARELFNSYLNNIFLNPGRDWEQKELAQLGVTQTGTTPKTADKSNYGKHVPFIKPADFNKDGSLNYSNEGLSEKGLKEARNIPAGSVLMVCIGATIGKCGYCEKLITSNQQINALTPERDVSYKFVYYQMLTRDFQQRVLHSSGQATLPLINKSKWNALKIMIPRNLEVQNDIVDRLNALLAETERLEITYAKKLQNLEELKKSVLQKAFSGELVGANS